MPNVVKMQLNDIKNVARIQQKCSQNGTRIKSENSQNVVRMQSKFSRNEVRIQSESTQSQIDQNRSSMESSSSQLCVDGMGFDGMVVISTLLCHISLLKYCIGWRLKIAEFSKATSRGKGPKQTLLWLFELRMSPQGMGRRDTERILYLLSATTLSLLDNKISVLLNTFFWGEPSQRGVGGGKLVSNQTT